MFDYLINDNFQQESYKDTVEKYKNDPHGAVEELKVLVKPYVIPEDFINGMLSLKPMEYQNSAVVKNGKTIFHITEIDHIPRIMDNYASGSLDKKYLEIAGDGWGNCIALDLSNGVYCVYYHDKFKDGKNITIPFATSFDEMIKSLTPEDVDDVEQESMNEDVDDEDIFVEYNNPGRRNINRKMLGHLNHMIPPFKRILKGLEDETMEHREVDKFSSGLSRIVAVLFNRGGLVKTGTSHTATGDGWATINGIKLYVKKARKSKEFDSEEIAAMENLVDTLDEWKNVAHIDKKSLGFFDRHWRKIDTRDAKMITDATRKACDELVKVRDIVSSHYHSESYIEGDRFFDYIINE